jgi:hypothetical protein
VSDTIYEHDLGFYNNYYGIRYPHIIDLIAVQNPEEIKYSSNIYYSAKTEYSNPATNSFENLPSSTFTSLIAYNSTQSTGKIDLTFKSNPFQSDDSSTSALVARTDRQYRISNLRDAVNDSTQPIWSSNWNHTSANYFIDKVPSPINIDFTKSAFNQTRLRDYYLGIRLFFDQPQNYKIVTDIVNTVTANRNR